MGHRYRAFFLVSLFLCSFGRAVGLSINIFIQKADLNFFMVAQILKSIPTLLFITSFSFLIYFFSLIVSIEEWHSNMAWPMIIGLNLLTYLTYIFITIYRKLYLINIQKRTRQWISHHTLCILWSSILSFLHLHHCVWNED